MTAIMLIERKLFLCYIIIVLSGCQKSSDHNSLNNQVFDDVLFEAMKNTKGDFIRNKKIVLHHLSPDSLRKYIVKRILNNYKNSTSNRIELLVKLYSVIGDSVALNLKSNSKYFHFYENDDQINQIVGDSDYIGSINLSPVVLDSNKLKGCFYLAFQCRTIPNCSSGYIIFFKRSGLDTQWGSIEAIQIWGG